MIAFNCPHCEKFCEAPEELAGSQAQCSRCEGLFDVPYFMDLPRKRSGMPLFIVFAVIIHIAIYLVAIHLWERSQAGDEMAVLAGCLAMFLGALGLTIVVVTKARKRT